MRFINWLVLIVLGLFGSGILWWSLTAPVERLSAPDLAAPPRPAQAIPRGSGLHPELVAPESKDRNGRATPGLPGLPDRAKRAPAPDPIGAGRARLLVKVTGAPVAQQETAPGLRRFNLGVRSERTNLNGWRLEFDLEGPGATATWDVPAGLPLRFSLVALGRSADFHQEPVTLEEGSTGELAVDLGHGSVRSVQLAGIPCDVLGGLRVETRGHWGFMRLPGGQSGPLEVRATGLSDPTGRALVLAPDGADVAYTIGLKGRVFAASVQEVQTGQGGALLAMTPAAPLVTLRSAPGTELFVEKGIVSSPSEWKRRHEPSESNVVLLPSQLSEPQRVLLDGKSLGMIGADAWPAGKSHCLDVEDLHWSGELASVAIEVHGFEKAKARLMVYRHSRGAGPKAKPAELRGPRRNYEVVVDSSWWQMPVGAVHEADHIGIGPISLGKWASEANGVRSCEVYLEPGEYVACLELGNVSRRILRLEPFVMGGAGTQTLQLDESQIRKWAIVPRDAEGGRCAGLAMPGNMWVGAIKLGPSERVHGPWPYEEGPEGGPEPSFDIETFGARPTDARLSRSPGANGRLVPLRPSVPSDAAGSAELVAIVPAAQMLHLAIPPVEGGSLGGAVDGESSVMDVDRIFSSDVEVVPNTVSFDEERGMSLSLRSERVAGVITESKRSNLHVRDWFSATKDGIELASGGRGRFINLKSTFSSVLRLRIVPGPVGDATFSAAYHGDLHPGTVRRLWIPEAAQRLEWWDGDAIIGSSDNLALDEIVIE